MSWILGITGGVGCGKSAVLDILATEYGAYVIQADLVAHELMAPGGASYEKIVAVFGEEILVQHHTENAGHVQGDGGDKNRSDGGGVVCCQPAIDRKALGAIVFHDEDKLRLLNSLTHPEVKREIRRRVASSTASFIVIEAALLLEEHYEEICDEIWYVYADQEIRLQRLKQSRGYSREKTLSMMQNQKSEAQFRTACQETIDNSGTLEHTRNQLRELLIQRSIAAMETSDS